MEKQLFFSSVQRLKEILLSIESLHLGKSDLLIYTGTLKSIVQENEEILYRDYKITENERKKITHELKREQSVLEDNFKQFEQRKHQFQQEVKNIVECYGNSTPRNQSKGSLKFGRLQKAVGYIEELNNNMNGNLCQFKGIKKKCQPLFSNWKEEIQVFKTENELLANKLQSFLNVVLDCFQDQEGKDDEEIFALYNSLERTLKEKIKFNHEFEKAQNNRIKAVNYMIAEISSFARVCKKINEEISKQLIQCDKEIIRFESIEDTRNTQTNISFDKERRSTGFLESPDGAQFFIRPSLNYSPVERFTVEPVYDRSTKKINQSDNQKISKIVEARIQDSFSLIFDRLEAEEDR